MAKQCRTCAQAITNNEYFYVNGSSLISTTLQVHDILISFIPDFDFNLLPNSAICRNCMSTLHIAYTFKEQIIRNELLFQKQNDNDSESVANETFYLNSPDNQTRYLDEYIINSDQDKEISQDNANCNQPNDKIDSKILNSYIDHISGKEKKQRTVNRPYKCDKCDFTSDNKTCLVMHIRIHSGEKPFQCTECSYQAKRKSHLESHMLNMHTNQSPLECAVCDKVFRAKQNLLKHQRIHTGQKPYQCNKCDFKSGHRSSVINHVKRVHMGILQPAPEKMCTCELCGKTFARQSSLNVHMRIHTGVKSHLCELCGKHFRETGILRNHLLTHQDKAFKCNKCSYVANRKAHLQQHMQIYGEHNQLFYCNQCDHHYANTFNLSKHMKEAHLNEEEELIQNEAENMHF